MASTDRALLANVDVYLAEGNVRRALAGFANNMLARTAGGEFQERRLLLEHGQTSEIESIDGNSATIIRCSKPITVTANVLPDISAPAVFTVNSLFIYTGELGNIILAVTGLTSADDSKVTFLQI
jgi:hypothetical protein